MTIFAAILSQQKTVTETNGCPALEIRQAKICLAIAAISSSHQGKKGLVLINWQ